MTLKVYDLPGREIATLANEERLAGSYKETFDVTGLSSGVCIYRLRANNNVTDKKLLLLK